MNSAKKNAVNISFYLSHSHAGFCCPADYVDNVLDVNELVITHPAATYFVWVTGESLINAAIWEDDVPCVDKVIDQIDGSIIVALRNCEFLAKRLNEVYLMPENPL